MNDVKGKRGYGGLICGIVIAAAGLVMLGVNLGWIPEGIFSSIPFIPLAMIFFGGLIIHSAVAGRRRSGDAGDRTGGCC